MNLPSYREVLKMGEQKIKDALIPVRVKRARKQAELEMIKLEEELATKEAALQEECAKEDIDFNRIINMQDRIGLLGRKIRQYQNILDEMFPEE